MQFQVKIVSCCYDLEMWTRALVEVWKGEAYLDINDIYGVRENSNVKKNRYAEHSPGDRRASRLHTDNTDSQFSCESMKNPPPHKKTQYEKKNKNPLIK